LISEVIFFWPPPLPPGKGTRLSSSPERAGSRRSKGLIAALYLGLSLILCPTEVVAQAFPEYQVKAEMLFRIAEFVDWPAQTFSDPDQPFVIAIIGKDPFGSYLASRAKSEKIHGRPVEIRSMGSSDPDALSGCRILFFSQGEQPRFERLINTLADHPILLVGDSEDFVRLGTHLGFQMVQGRIRFHVNLGTAQRSDLTIPPGLLRLAVRVHQKKSP
jgi:hypothetical protein